MFDKIFKNMSVESQGMLALILGLLLIFGTLGKLQVLQSILNSIMIFTGLLLIIWGMHAGKGLDRLKALMHSRKK